MVLEILDPVSKPFVDFLDELTLCFKSLKYMSQKRFLNENKMHVGMESSKTN